MFQKDYYRNIMASLKKHTSFGDYQKFVNEVYGISNLRNFSVDDMITNITRFSMRGLKGIRKNDVEKVKINIVIALSWFMSLMNQLDINIEEAVWQRFPYCCSYCGECPCACKVKKVQKRVKIKVNDKLFSKSIGGFQKMFNEIYPAQDRTLEHAGIHLAEEVGELSESILAFKGQHTAEGFAQLKLEASDLVSCIMGVFNSAGIDYEKTLVEMFTNGCHECKQTPCACQYSHVVNYKS